jgi:hypothetical protein
LILTPLAVGPQTVLEGEKFGIACQRVRDGMLGPPGIYVTNYEQLHKFSSDGLSGVVCDESSILKHFSGATQKAVTRFMAKVPYRLLCTATAAPNDYTELGTSSEALGALGHSDMLTRFFVMEDAKRSRFNDVKLARAANANHFAKLSYRVSQQISKWRMKGHAQIPFWRWVCSWSRACRMPSDLGFANERFQLPPLTVANHIIKSQHPLEGMLFPVPAVGLREERDERRKHLQERCELVAALADHRDPVVVWCHLNVEGDLLEQIIPGSIQVAGRHTDEEKEAAYERFRTGEARVIITKPKIGAWGLNWQHCAHVITFASHSYEQYYQSIRRCWRFGQQRPVRVDVLATEGEEYVLANMTRKAEAADRMFTELVTYMHEAQHLERETDPYTTEVPSWAFSINS